jgi:hypothetical protein
MSEYIAIRAKYYKISGGKKVIAHCLRLGAHSKNQNVTKPENQKMNIYSFDKKKFDEVEEQHQKAIGKKPQKNRNAIFETVIIFSEENFTRAGVKNHEEYLEKYMENIKEEYGFEPLGFSLHMDEGDKKVNTHAHAFFYNYDFKKKKAPLRDLMKKGNDINGQVNKLNPAFVKMQDVAAATFEPLGYVRGESKDVTSAEHKNKEQFVKNKLLEIKEDVNKLHKNKIETINEIEDRIEENQALKKENGKLKRFNEMLKAQMPKWFIEGFEYIKKSLKGEKATNEAMETIKAEPNIHKNIKRDFYNELVKLSKNEEIKEDYKKLKEEARSDAQNCSVCGVVTFVGDTCMSCSSDDIEKELKQDKAKANEKKENKKYNI